MGYEINRSNTTPKYAFLGLGSYPVDCILDIGANEGQFARRASAKFPGADLFMFEPLEEPFLKLKIWWEFEILQNLREKTKS